MTLEGWSRKTIGDLCNFSNGYGFRPPDWSKEGLPIIRIQNLNGSKEFNYFSGVPDESWIIEPGTILFAWAGTRGVSFGPTIWNGPRGVLNQHIFRVQPFEDINPLWLYAALEAATSNIERKAHGFKATLLHVRKEEITRQIVYTPLPLEQQRIVDILSTWDRAIDLATQLIAAKQQYKRGLVQQLLTGKRKFASTRGWSWRKIGDLFHSTTRFESWDDEKIYIQAIVRRWSQGIEVRPPLLGKQIKTKNLQVIRTGDFLISDIQASYGAMSIVRDKQDGLYVSNVYTILVPRDEKQIHTSYFDQLARTSLMRHLVAQSSNGFKAERIRLGFVLKTFMQQKVYLPDDIDEQKRIADILQLCDDEITLLNRKLELLKKQKQGLMQQLLTGKVRVKV